ncbi:hypothetical protein T02_1316 [Trichinella nativa]|uniref:Uncharacterized protein n=1 Tax=Trichinella nativa TaxID=6335 RepID=A0A0V1LD02_9BILA|nr:hypothetical protein T02_1316 [Trichinella nativa]
MSLRRYRQMRPSSPIQLRPCCHSTCMSWLHSGGIPLVSSRHPITAAVVRSIDLPAGRTTTGP